MNQARGVREAGDTGDAEAAPQELLAGSPRILSLCCLYPNPAYPAQGVFVQRRLQHLARLTPVRVVAPLGIVHYGRPPGKRLCPSRRICGAERWDGAIPVLHPRWFYPPFSGSFLGFWLFLQLLQPLRRLRRDFPFEILDTHFGYPEGIAGCLLAQAFGLPFTMTLRGNEPKHSRGALERQWMGWALRRASRVFAVSERLRQFAIGLGAVPENVKTIPNGVDAGVFWQHDRESCRRKYGFPPDGRLILSAGALVERKGHHRAIRALAAIPAGEAPVQLAVAGSPGPEGQYEKELRQLVSSLGLEDRVHFLGAIPADALAEVMSAADVLCLASSNEGWPNVVHEALACGTPVVATDVGAIPEMLGGGRFGIIVPVNSQAKLEQALRAALDRDWDRAAIAEWGQKRSWNHVAAEVFDQMREIVAREHRPDTAGTRAISGR
jgi:glycosyltransferase involved in cell wall biosynthesis